MFSTIAKLADYADLLEDKYDRDDLAEELDKIASNIIARYMFRIKRPCMGRGTTASNMDISFDTKSTGRSDWDNDILKSKDFNTHIVMMTPDEFLKAVDYKRYHYDQEKINKIKSDILGNKITLPSPSIIWGPMGTKYSPAFHDGQHRMMALKELNYTAKVPVIHIYEK